MVAKLNNEPISRHVKHSQSALIEQQNFSLFPLWEV